MVKYFMKEKKYTKIRNDIILIAIILVIVGALFLVYFLNRSNGKRALIYHDSELILEVDLNTDREYIVKGDISSMIIVVNDGGIFVKESGCPNQTCVNEGSIMYSNEVIACLPNHIYIKIKED